MFGLVQSSQPGPTDQPVIELSEKSDTLDRVLRLCYPVPKPDLTNAAVVMDLLGVAHKYEMSTVVSRLKSPLRRFIETNPLRVFALACSYQLDDIAKEAAEAWRAVARSRDCVANADTPWNLTPAGESYRKEMAAIPSTSYFHLVEYVQDGFHPHSYCSFFHKTTDSRISLDIQDLHRVVCQNFGIDPDLAVRSMDNVVLPAHKVVLSAASSVLRELVLEADEDGTMHLTETGHVLALVLQACYTSVDVFSVDMPLIFSGSILKAAVRYRLPVLERAAKLKLEGYLPSDPLDVYCSAVQLRWEEGARAAAVQLSRLPILELCTPQMNTMPARFYHRLLKFHFDYRRAFVGIFRLPKSNPVRDQIIAGELWEDWLWKDTTDLHPELILATAIQSARASHEESSPQGWVEVFCRPKEELAQTLSKVCISCYLAMMFI